MSSKIEPARSSTLPVDTDELHIVMARIDAALATLSLAELRQVVEEIEAVVKPDFEP